MASLTAFDSRLSAASGISKQKCLTTEAPDAITQMVLLIQNMLSTSFKRIGREAKKGRKKK